MKLKNKCDNGICPKIKRPSKRNVKDPEMRKTIFVTGDKFPSCPPEKDTFFFHQKKNKFYTYKNNKWVIANTGHFNVETSATQNGPTTSGPFKVTTDGDTLRLWSAGGIQANVEEGSALVNIEPNIIFVGEDVNNFEPSDPTRPAIYFDTSSNRFYIWNPDNTDSSSSNWFEPAGGSGVPSTGDTIEVSQITENENNDHVVIDKAVFTNLTGLSKIYLDSMVEVDHDEFGGIINPNVWNVELETGPNSALPAGGTGHYIVPSAEIFNNEFLGDSSGVILEVKIKVGFEAIFFEEDDERDFVYISLVKNKTEELARATAYPIFYPPRRFTLQINETILCNPGDTLDVHLTKELAEDGKITIFDESSNTSAVFKIIGFAPPS